MTRRRLTKRLRAAEGFTLVEMLVVIASGITLVMAIFGVFDASVRQSQAATDRVQATQIGRVAMERVLQELNSSCVWSTVPPIQVGSDGTHIWFLSAFSSSPLPNPVLHEIYLAPGGNLDDASYALTDPSTPPAGWTASAFNATPFDTHTLATDVSLISGTSAMFQYYEYVNGHLATTAAYQLASPLTATTAPEVGAVTVSYAASPSDNSSQADRTINLTDTATIVPPPGPGGGCQ